MKTFLCSLVCLIFTCSAYPWGGQGHKAIGIVAADMLTLGTRAHIKAILGNDDLSYISTWMDDARLQMVRHTGPLKDDAEAIAFNKAFPSNASWHFVNLPVGSTAVYSNSSPFASPDDIVHAINDAVAVLEGTSAKYSKVQAMRVLVHMVGDIHQPMHCIAGYFDITDLANPKLITDAAQAVGKPNDRGGNQLYFTASLELHSLWDTRLVERIAKTPDPWLLADVIKPDANITKWATPSDYHQWPAEWVGDTAAEAAKAYEGILFEKAGMEGNKIRIEIGLPGGTRKYSDIQEIRAKTQLAKAAVHLAQLLNSIHFSSH